MAPEGAIFCIRPAVIPTSSYSLFCKYQLVLAGQTQTVLTTIVFY